MTIVRAARKIWSWATKHTDHLIAGVVTSLPISIGTNLVMHHMHWILMELHIPVKIISFTGN